MNKYQNITQLIEVIVNNYNNFPLVDYDEIAQIFVNKYIEQAKKIKSRYDISNWPIDENILIDEFWDNVVIATASRNEYDLICQMIMDYYSPIVKHTDSIYQIINITDYNSKHLYYDINFFENNETISWETLNNIELFFFLYNETSNFNLLNRLKTRYIYPLMDAIKEYLIENIVIQDRRAV